MAVLPHHMLSIAALALEGQLWVVVTETIWPTNSELITVWHFTEKLCADPVLEDVVPSPRTQCMLCSQQEEDAALGTKDATHQSQVLFPSTQYFTGCGVSCPRNFGLWSRSSKAAQLYQVPLNHKLLYGKLCLRDRKWNVICRDESSQLLFQEEPAQQGMPSKSPSISASAVESGLIQVMTFTGRPHPVMEQSNSIKFWLFWSDMTSGMLQFTGTISQGEVCAFPPHSPPNNIKLGAWQLCSFLYPILLFPSSFHMSWFLINMLNPISCLLPESPTCIMDVLG